MATTEAYERHMGRVALLPKQKPYKKLKVGTWRYSVIAAVMTLAIMVGLVWMASLYNNW